MRYAVYMVAILASAGFVYVLSQPADDNAPEAAADTNEAVAAAASDVEGTEKFVTLSVPEMHCPSGCYPTVKKTLEEQPGVLAVDLVEQKEEGVLDKREVNIKFAGTFDSESAINSLSKAGFEKSSVVQ